MPRGARNRFKTLMLRPVVLKWQAYAGGFADGPMWVGLIPASLSVHYHLNKVAVPFPDLVEW